MSEMRVLILKEGTSRSRGREAQRSNIMAAEVLDETVRSTIGPKGMDKMLVAGMGDIVITNDGATIMKEMDVQNPAAKMLVEVAKTQDSEVGDGTTTAVVLAGELLAGAEALLDKDIHPNVIIDGYRDAAESNGRRNTAAERQARITEDRDQCKDQHRQTRGHVQLPRRRRETSRKNGRRRGQNRGQGPIHRKECGRPNPIHTRQERNPNSQECQQRRHGEARESNRGLRHRNLEGSIKGGPRPG